MCVVKLVCDYGNGRVQELTELGEAELQQMHEESHCTVPVGRNPSMHPAAEVHWRVGNSLAAWAQSIGPAQKAPDQWLLCMRHVRLTLDGLFIVAAEYSGKHLSVFQVCDGSFLKHIGVGAVADGHKDVMFAPTND
jgi:hypothetical protein